MRKLLLAPVIAAAALLATAVPAFAHDNSITASSTCTSQAAGTWSATYTVTNDYGLAETAHLSGAVNTTLALGVHPGPNDHGSVTAAGLTGNSSTESEYGVWSDGYQSSPHSATALKPAGCTPVIHTPTITGVVTCSLHGKYRVIYSALDLQGGTALQPLPEKHLLPGNVTSDSYSVQVAYSNGPTETATASVVMSGKCRAPSPPKKTHAPIKRPTARFIGPCGDPYYGAVFNNSRSNKTVTFRWSYVNFYTGKRVSVVSMVGGGHIEHLPFRHVLGNTRMKITTANGHLLAAGYAAPPGDYGSCR